MLKAFHPIKKFPCQINDTISEDRFLTGCLKNKESLYNASQTTLYNASQTMAKEQYDTCS